MAADEGTWGIRQAMRAQRGSVDRLVNAPTLRRGRLIRSRVKIATALQGLLQLCLLVGGCRAGVSVAPGDEAEPTTAETTSTLTVRILSARELESSPTVEVAVALERVAPEGASAETVVERTVSGTSGSPYMVALTYQPADLKPEGRYRVRASVKDNGQFLCKNAHFTPAFRRHAPSNAPGPHTVDVVVQCASVHGESETTATSGSELEDSPLFRRWRLTSLHSKTIGARFDKKASILLTTTEDGNRFRGTVGCTKVTGVFTTEGESLRFPSVFSFRTDCAGGRRPEWDLRKALHDTRRYEASNEALILYAHDGRILVKFEPHDDEEP